MSAAGMRRPAPEGVTEERVFESALCAIDGTEDSLAAVDEAATLVGSGGHMTLLVATAYRAEGERRSPAIGPLRAKGMIDEAVAIATAGGLSCDVEVDPASPPSRVVIERARGHDLIAMGAPVGSWFAGLFLGGVAVTAERALPAPLLFAHHDPSGGEDVGPLLVASDGLEASDELVDLAGRLARGRRAPAILLHAFGAHADRHPASVDEQARRLHAATDGGSEMRLAPGVAHTAIVGTSGAVGASLVLMCSRRHRGPAMFGSVSRRVVHQGERSVLLVPPERLLVA
ncbi:MAG TPA: universal stress protein [Solirubrobacteraceae bacterium]|nr:universal stress protein [Solirubrobacteraceae bacterium]